MRLLVVSVFLLPLTTSWSSKLRFSIFLLPVETLKNGSLELEFIAILKAVVVVCVFVVPDVAFSVSSSSL